MAHREHSNLVPAPPICPIFLPVCGGTTFSLLLSWEQRAGPISWPFASVCRRGLPTGVEGLL